MLNEDNPYYLQVALVFEALPFINQEPCFALKGGTAINFFIRDMPWLSVDIDLTYLPVQDRPTSLTEIGSALQRLATSLESTWRDVRIDRLTEEGHVLKLLLRRRAVQIKIEVSPVLRGCVGKPTVCAVIPKVETQFGYSEISVVHSDDLYAGKLCAALDRQHPRDLFDVQQLLEHEEISNDLIEVFLVYLLSGSRTLADMLAPTFHPLTTTFEEQFRGMALTPVTVEELERTRKTMIHLIHERFTERHRQFLLSFKRGEPDWNLLNVKDAQSLPAVQWKLLNIRKMPSAKHNQAVERLQHVLSG